MTKNPIPQGHYRPAARYGNLVCTAGMTPRKDGVLLFAGKVRKDEPVEIYREAVEQAAKNALQASGKFIPWQVITISTDGNIL